MHFKAQVGLKVVINQGARWVKKERGRISGGHDAGLLLLGFVFGAGNGKDETRQPHMAAPVSQSVSQSASMRRIKSEEPVSYMTRVCLFLQGNGGERYYKIIHSG